MAGFIYYIPGRSGLVKSAEYPALGLAHIATKGEPECRDCRSGPDGTGGAIIVPQHPSAPESLFKPNEQNWRKAPGGKWWVGYFNAQRPGPADLDRQTMTEGTAVHLRRQ